MFLSLVYLSALLSNVWFMIADLIYTTLWPNISQVKVQHTATLIWRMRLYDVGKDHEESMLPCA